MQTDDEAPVTNQEDNIDASDHVNNKLDKSDLAKKSDAEDPKPRIVLTFRSEKSGARTSNMKIVSTEEKHEDISPRRSSRTRGIKKESDEDIVSHLESEDDNSHDSAQKRSTRRQSKEYSDVIANAIARKEKSFETSSAPSQRLSRRIKPTAKILANEELRMGLESQNNARLGISNEKPIEEGVRTRRSAQTRHIETKPVVEKKASKRKVHDETTVDSSDRESDSSNKKLMHLCNLGLKVIAKDEESSEAENRKTESSANEAAEDDEEDDEDDEDDDDDDEEIDDDTEVISKLLEADEASASDEEFCPEVKKKRSRRNCSPAPLRRSSRKANSGLYYYEEHYGGDSSDSDYEPKRKNSRSHDDDEAVLPSDGDAETKVAAEAASAEEASEAACPTEASTIMATCYCEDSSNIYAAPSELTEPVFCQAIELVDGVRVGCSHAAAREAGGGLQPMRRAGPRSPYFLSCRQHAAQLAKHMCCPACGLFCTQGIFYQCSKEHLFHLECGIPGGDKQKTGCPHCGVHSYRWLPANKEFTRVRVDMHCSNKRVFLPDQREQCTPAFLGFSSIDPSHLDQGPSIPEDLLPSLPYDLKTLFADVDNEDEMGDHSIHVLYEAIMAGEPVGQLIPKIVRGDHINAPLAELEGGTCAHAAAARGRLSALCLLQYAGANVDAVDTASRTPLMRAILSLLDKETPEEGVPETNEEEEGDKKEDDNVNEAEDGEIERRNSESNEKEDHKTEDSEGKGDDKENVIKIETDEVNEEEHSEEKEDTKEMEVDKDIESEEKEVKTELKDEEPNDDPTTPSDEDLIKVIKYLVAVGCDVNKQGPEGMTALHMAAQYGGDVVCSILLNSGGADVDPRDQGGWTPLVRAAENKHANIVKLLLEHGAEATASDNEGNLAVHWCVLSGDARCLSLLLRAAPHTLAAPNAHTDTPLHVAAREGHYACVVILLAHGAKTDLENSAGELPVEVCSDRCQDAITLNMQMTLAVRDKIPRHRILSNDVSNGRELHPVPCVNEVDDATLPEDFVYVSQHVAHTHVPVDDTIDTMQGCACADGDCGAAECACGVLGVRRWYTRGRLPPHFPHHDPPMLFECNQTCACNLKRCTNRVVSRVEATGSLAVLVEVYRTERCGWGLRTQQRVPRGALVALYRGELLGHEQADSRSNDQYMFALDLKPDLLEECNDKTQLCVDAARFGSAARFMNHSCRPTVAPVRVFSAVRDLRAPNVALFALRDLPAGCALTFDYGDKFWSVKSKWIKCECESPDCRYPTKTVEEPES